ncbi:MAG: hypothetical protein EOP28_00360 [Rhodococcus sp. (in: high G+C Gram-positive bacteria)]|nr:MAG: hypothetical protein EOP28_00360 [Rhodococcus sp. (in: high G+C Gram-positive bacteria)]
MIAEVEDGEPDMTPAELVRDVTDLAQTNIKGVMMRPTTAFETREIEMFHGVQTKRPENGSAAWIMGPGRHTETFIAPDDK